MTWLWVLIGAVVVVGLVIVADIVWGDECD